MLAPARRLVWTHPAQPGGRRQAVHAAHHRPVLEVAERGDVALVRLERRHDRTQLEVGARAARRPPVHLRAVRRVAHDRAVRDVEESHAQLRCRGRLRQRGRSRDHRIQQRQRQRDTGAAQHGPAGQMSFRQEHESAPSQFRPRTRLWQSALGSCDVGSRPVRSGRPCMRKASLVTMPETMADSR